MFSVFISSNFSQLATDNESLTEEDVILDLVVS